MNAYFDAHPGHVLGAYELGAGLHGAPSLRVTARRGAHARAAGAARSARSPPRAARDGRTFTPRPAALARARARRAGARRGAVGRAPAGARGRHASRACSTASTRRSRCPPASAPSCARCSALRDSRQGAARRRRPRASRTPRTPTRCAPSCARAMTPTRPATGRSTASRCDRPAAPTPTRARRGWRAWRRRVMRTLRSDPFAPLVAALESFDEATQTAAPATLLAQRALTARTPVLGAETADEALAVCLEARGRVELEHIAELLGTTTRGGARGARRARLRGPRRRAAGPGGRVPLRQRARQARARRGGRRRAARAGRQRQRAARRAAAGPGHGRRAGAPRRRLDRRRDPPGVPARDPRRPRRCVVEHPGGAVWGVRGNNRSVAATSEWGTERMPAPAIAKAVLEQRPIQVTDEPEPGRRVVNPVETAAAVEKAAALQERFGEWVWEDPERGSAAAGRVQPALQRARAARLHRRGRAADAARARAHRSSRERTSAPPSRACSTSPPSACFTRSGPARPPRW